MFIMAFISLYVTKIYFILKNNSVSFKIRYNERKFRKENLICFKYNFERKDYI